MQPVVERAAAALTLVIWIYLGAGRGRFWTTAIRLPVAPDLQRWPDVVAVVPARDEAQTLPRTLPTLVRQRYAGRFRVIVVDDDSSDGTGEIAAAAGASVQRSSGPPPGWAGKVAAVATGVAVAGSPQFLFFTDADVEHPPDAVARLVRAAVAERYVLTSQMVRLRAQARWERVLVPAFVWFFAQLYPFARVNRPGRTAAAAGGCMLVRGDVLAAAGGLAAIRGAVIDDVALARLLKPHGHIWLGLADDMISVRSYPRLADLWQMIARSAYTQLRYSPVLLVATVLGLTLAYLVPPVAVIVGAVHGDALVWGPGALAWVIMSATYVPMLRFYAVPAWAAPALPAVAALYAAMTVDSARRHRAGRGASWKGRVAAGN